MNLHNSLPLQGMKVVDLTAAMLGPSATQVLGDFGADVIKVERPDGDTMRYSFSEAGGIDNPIFLSVNRNKRGIRLDLKQEGDMAVLLDLIKSSDVLVSNFRAGVMEKLGLSYEDLKEINPQLIWASGTPFGSRGPEAHKAGIDLLAQAASGLMHTRTSGGSSPQLDPIMAVDYTGSMHLAMGILLAWIHLQVSGKGQKVEVSLFDSALSLQIMEATEWLTNGTERDFARMPLNGVYETLDGFILMLGVFHRNALTDISKALGFNSDLTKRPEFSSHDAQIENIEALQQIFADRIKEENTAYWLETLNRFDIKCSSISSLKEALSSEQTKVNGMIVSSRHPNPEIGDYRTLGSPMRLSECSIKVRQTPPTLGEHDEEILGELGYTRNHEGKVVGESTVEAT